MVLISYWVCIFLCGLPAYYLVWVSNDWKGVSIDGLDLIPLYSAKHYSIHEWCVESQGFLLSAQFCLVLESWCVALSTRRWFGAQWCYFQFFSTHLPTHPGCYHVWEELPCCGVEVIGSSRLSCPLHDISWYMWQSLKIALPCVNQSWCIPAVTSHFTVRWSLRV